ncbi:MAG: PLD nuclease N-terminal domain-containing protein [Dehalococcoidia bacterium]|nr:PLD nuclease N-terminal domain-containing protein [Dehalococcoidia bacterium]
MDWGVFWAFVFLMFVWVPLLCTWVFAIADLFLRHDLRWWSKAIWLLGILFFPLIGILVYAFTRPRTVSYGMVPTGYVQATPAGYPANYAAMTGTPVASPVSADADSQRLSVLSDLHDRGVINDDDYNRGRSMLLGA